ncbi:MAG: hypothetical protein JWQ71_2935 [Pedosphaera sp.]|nr:hypothetical protein [Pedosphaera sp.]
MNDWNESEWFRMWLDMARSNMQGLDLPRNESGNLSFVTGNSADDLGQSHHPQWEVTE